MSEPMYDDLTLELIEGEERKDLVAQLWQYALTLEDYVIRLRNQINTLSEKQRQKVPFLDPAVNGKLKTAILDRLAYRCNKIMMDGKSYRLENRKSFLNPKEETANE
jgi:DNA replication protein DnaC